MLAHVSMLSGSPPCSKTLGYEGHVIGTPFCIWAGLVESVIVCKASPNGVSQVSVGFDELAVSP